MELNIEKVDRLITEGKIWSARERLYGHLGSNGFNAQVFLKLVEVYQLLGEENQAARFAFYSGVRTDETNKLSAAYLGTITECNSVFDALSDMPKAFRRAESHQLPSIVKEELINAGYEESAIDMCLYEKSRRRREGKNLSKSDEDDRTFMRKARTFFKYFTLWTVSLILIALGLGAFIALFKASFQFVYALVT